MSIWDSLGTSSLPQDIEYGYAVNVRESPGAAGDGIADDTDAFGEASDLAGVGGTIVVPSGTYLLDDWLPQYEMQTIRGVGRMNTWLKAKAGAEYVVDITQLRDVTLADLTIHGNGRASKGIRFRGGASATGSERNGLERVGVTQCSTGIDIVTHTVDQVDKQTFWRVFLNDNGISVSIDAINGQQQIFIQSHIEQVGGTGIVLKNGTLDWLGGQWGMDNGTGLVFSGSTIQWVNLQSLITEGMDIAIDGNTHWPINGVTIQNSYIDADTYCVRAGAGINALMRLNARDSTFLRGQLALAGGDFQFVDDYCRYDAGATVAMTGTSSARVGRNAPYQGVASASTITIPHGCKVAQISGTTQINAITAAGNRGRIVTLYFLGSVTVAHNVNNVFLNGAANFVATANDTLTLFCDGTNWYETGRAVI